MPPYTSDSQFCNYSINDFHAKMPISPSWTINQFISVVSSRNSKDISIYLRLNDSLVTPSELNIRTLLGDSLDKEFYIVSKEYCCICFENCIQVQLKPCNHSITCFQCANHKTITSCPICRTPIEQIKNI